MRTDHRLAASRDIASSSSIATRAVRGDWIARLLALGVACAALLLTAGSAVASVPLVWSDPFAIVHDQPGSAGANELGAISCPSAAFCAATDAFGSVVTSTRPGARTKAWAEARVGAVGLSDISCPSVSLCVSVGGQPDALVSSHPAGRSAGWRTTPLALPVYAENPPTALGVSCPSASFCVVVGDQPVCLSYPFHGCNSGPGFVATTHNPTGGTRSWSIVELPSAHAGLVGVTCPSAKLCIAWDANGGLDVTTRPAGGPAAWRTVATDTAGPTAVSCATITMCVATTAGGNVLTSVHPTVKGSWTVTHIDATALNDISCPSVSLCVAVDLDGNALASTRPAGGAARWKLSAIDRLGATDPLYIPLQVACPSIRLCVAVDQDGHALLAGAGVLSASS